jgi:NitT/TauT family transport system substrate-binding protein
VFVIGALGGIMSACGIQPQSGERAATTESAANAQKAGTLRVSLQGAPGARDVPFLMALDSLKEQGYAVEIVNFVRSDLIAEALLRGDLDVGSVNPNTLWVAIAKGAALRTIGAKSGMTFRLVAKRDIRTCRDLQSRAVAFAGTRATNKAMFDSYLTTRCPGVTPAIVMIPESSNRLAALQTGEIDAAMLDLEEGLYVADQAPEDFHVLVDLAKEFPEIQFSSFAVPTVWAEQYPETLRDFIRALLVMHRRIVEKPRLLQAEIATRMALDMAEAQNVTDAFLAANAFDPNGGLTEQNVQATIDFLTDVGSLPAGVRTQDVADLTHLNAVLDEIGRK